VHVQDGFWWVKILAILGLFVGAFFIPNSVFEYYGWVALGASSLFILVQLVLLVDFAHSWAENWIGKMEDSEEGDNKWYAILLTTTSVMGLACLAMVIVMFIFFHSCGYNVAFITFNLIFSLFVCALSIHPKVQEANPRSGLLQPVLISLYCTYLVFSAIQSESDECNPWDKMSRASNTSVLIGAIFTILAVCYATFRASSKMGEMTPETVSLMKDEESTGETSDKDHHDDDHHDKDSHHDEPVPYNFSRFHFVFALGAMYIAMLMTDWQTVYNPGSANATPKIDSGLAAVWVKVVSSWICFALYIWTLAGPAIFPDREWGVSS